IFTIGGSMAESAPGFVRMTMGICFGGALTIVVFAGSELFTGSNLVLTLGVFKKKATWGDLLSNWVWTWIGNLRRSRMLAVMIVRAGLLDGPAFATINAFVLKVVETKMNLPAEQLFLRAILANWFVCLGVWMAARIKDEMAKIMMIWWCMFTFITSGYEHSIANMFGLALGVLIPHGEAISWAGYWYNLGLATAGNVVGGAVFVAGLYWLGSPRAREQAAPATTAPVVAPAVNGTSNGTPTVAAPEP